MATRLRDTCRTRLRHLASLHSTMARTLPAMQDPTLDTRSKVVTTLLHHNPHTAPAMAHLLPSLTTELLPQGNMEHLLQDSMGLHNMEHLPLNSMGVQATARLLANILHTVSQVMVHLLLINSLLLLAGDSTLAHAMAIRSLACYDI